MDDQILNKHRLSDRIFYALGLAVDQGDINVADSLLMALEQSMTRNSGGGEFVERRDYPPEVEKVLARLRDLKANKN